ncbi:MAG: alpha/beta hydrolase [Alphaproteobacteria bacterium]|nr:alpha/beta hydrolase [Alphaproteobacteria bacterium]
MRGDGLACTTVGAHDADAAEVWFLHGILGSGRNWRSFARQLVERRPGWRAVLVDLRNHGDSHGQPPPHTLEACADDLGALAGARGSGPRVLVGHSFGGKVALTYAARGPHGLHDAWVVDAIPGPAVVSPGRDPDDTDVMRVLEAVAAMPLPIASHDALRDALVAQGFSSDLAGWMTTNLRREGDGFVWRFALDAVQAMIADYAARDLWPLVGRGPVRMHLVRAGRSGRWTSSDDARLEALQRQDLADVVRIEAAGHWVHVDAPEALLAAIAPTLTAA